MHELGTNPRAGDRARNWRRLTPATSLCTVVLLGLGGWAHFSNQPSDDAAEARPTLDRAASRGEFDVAPIQNEIDDSDPGRVMTASASVVGAAGDDIRANRDSDAEALSPDERLRRMIHGNWEDEYRGKRHLTVRDDGTGTMVVEPDGIGKRLFADELRFELIWSLENGRCTMKMLSGEPKSKVQLILKLYGQEADYKILDLNRDQMLLLDPDGKTRYDWRRPATKLDGEK